MNLESIKNLGDIHHFTRILINIIYCLSSFIWGFLMDKIGFKILNIIISCIEMGVSWSIYYLAGNKYIFIIENLLVSCCLSGTFTTIVPLFSKVFGKEISLEIYGLTGFFIQVARIVAILFIYFTRLDFSCFYLIGGGFCFMKFIALLCFKENESYKYKSNKEKDNKPEKKLYDIGIDN